MSYIKAIAIRGRPGNAVFEIGYALSVEPLQFTLQKVGKDNRYLGSSGDWQPDRAALTPQRVEISDGRTLIYVGPEVVDPIVEDERVCIEILPQEFRGEVVWLDIPPSSGRIGASVFIPRVQKPPILAGNGGVSAKDNRGGSSAPGVSKADAPPTDLPAPDTMPTETLLAPPSDPIQPSLVPPSSGGYWSLIQRVRASHWAILALPTLIIIVASGALWWQLRHQPQIADSTVPQRAIDSPPLTPVDEMRRLQSEVRELIEKNGDAARILEGGRRLVESDNAELRAFGFQAIDVAATRSSAPAQLQMGKFFDPRYFRRDRGEMEQANPTIAAEWYRRAAQGGASEATTELGGLCALLAQPSADINEDNRLQTIARYCN